MSVENQHTHTHTFVDSLQTQPSPLKTQKAAQTVAEMMDKEVVKCEQISVHKPPLPRFRKHVISEIYEGKKLFQA